MRKILIYLIILTFVACKNDPTKLLPNVTGKSGEIVLVIEPSQWSSDAGKEFRRAFTQAYPALPQNEPLFDLIHIPFSAFSNIFKTHRNLIVAKVDKEAKEPKILIRKNFWAKPQLIINIIAPSGESLANLIKEKGDILATRVLKKEMERYADVYKKNMKIEITEKLKRKFGIDIIIPSGYTLDLDTTNFVWLERRGLDDAVQGLLIYTYDKPEVELTTPFIMAKRNQVTKKYVPGPVANSYMAVENEMEPYRREIKMDGTNFIELRALWKVENDFMGGPFVSFTFVDEKKNKVINVDGFVYAPRLDKRNYIQQIEAVLNTVRFNKNESNNNK